MSLTSTLICIYKSPARDNVKHGCKHTSLARTSYPKQFSFKKGRIKSMSSLFSSFTIGSRRTYSSKEKSVLHFKVLSLACFSQVPGNWITDSVTQREKTHCACKIITQNSVRNILYSTKERKCLWSTSSKGGRLLHAFTDTSLFAILMCVIFTLHNSYTSMSSERYSFNFISKADNVWFPTIQILSDYSIFNSLTTTVNILTKT